MNFFNKNYIDNKGTASILRIGLGLVFVVGGFNKLSQLLDPERTLGIVGSYTGGKGYINEFFMTYLFSDGSLLSPWGFLTALSTFELLSGVALLVGLMVRPLALIYAFLLWTFVFSLPVVTTPGVETAVSTYTSPAMFVQMRDIALSGFMFVLLILGSGNMSADRFILTNGVNTENVDWDRLGLLLRLSLAAPLVIGGLFGNYANIATFATYQPLLLALGLILVVGVRTREVALVAAAVMVWFIFSKLNLEKSVIANLNGFKREFAFIAASVVIVLRGSGNAYTPQDLLQRIRYSFGRESEVPKLT